MKNHHTLGYIVRGSINILLFCFGLLPLHAQKINPSGTDGQATAPANSLSPQDDTSKDAVIVLSPFVVDASKDGGYRATSTLAGSRINTPLKDIAAPITVLTKEFLNDLGAVGINDIMAYVANGEGTGSYTKTSNLFGSPTDDILQNPVFANRIRGLEAADLTRDYFYSLGNQVGFDTYNLDQVTISRGPNSILAGLGSPAGIINYSPQLAGLGRNQNEVVVRFGSLGDQRYTFNSNYVAAIDVLAFRVAGAWSDKGFKQQPAFDKDKRLYFATTYQPWKKTTIRASYEQVKIDRNLPNNLTPEDSISQWIAVGKPTASPPATPSYGFVGFAAATPTLIYDKNGNLEGTRPVFLPYSYNYYQLNLTGAKIWQPLRLNNNKYMDLQNLNTNAQLANINYKTYSLSIDQEIMPKLHVSLAYNHEKVDQSSIVLFRPAYSALQIDVNTTLPWGAPNPHFGEFFMEQGGLDNKNEVHSTNEVLRGTITYDLDLTKRNRWLGRWRITGFAEQRETEFIRYGYTTKTVAGGITDLNARYYLGGGLSARATAVPIYHGLVSSVPRDYLDSTSGTWKKDTISSYFGPANNGKNLVNLDTQAVVIQSWHWNDRIVGLFGIRNDKNGATTLTKNFQPFDPSTPYPAKVELKGKTISYGVVAHMLPWLSFHYNKSENFIPNAGSIDLLANPTASPTGHGKDYGVSVSFFDDKLNIKLNHFDILSADGSAGGDAAFASQWGMPWFDTDVMKELARVAGKSYTQGIASSTFYGDSRLAKGYTANSVSKGLELEATYNVTKNWRVMGNIAKQEAVQSGVATALTSFIDQRIAYYKAQGLWNGPVGAAFWNTPATGEQIFNQWVLPNQLAYKSTDGKPSQQIAKWHASALTTYTFSEGKLKGWSAGGGLRYTDKAIIGNPALTDSSGAVTGLDIAHPYTVGSYIGVDGWIGYAMKLRDRYHLSFNLYGYDLQEGGHFHPISANSDGAHSVYRVIQPRSFYFTTKLNF